jgi:predicted nucleotidyltransferase
MCSQKSDQGCLRSRRRRAAARAARVLRFLKGIGVEAVVVGSLAENRFGLWSDVDFLIGSCPRSIKYSVEADVEAILGNLPFDTVYQEEIRSHYLPRMQQAAKTASEIVKVAA